MTDLETLIKNGESSQIEFKLSLPEDHLKYLKTVIAFANCKGGHLIFGVDDSTHKIVGMKAEKLFKTMDAISQSIYDSCAPAVPFDISLQTVQDKTLVVVQVYQGMNAPYYYKPLGMQEGCFVRVGATSRVADASVLQELVLEGSRSSYDQLAQGGKTATAEEIDALRKNLYQTALEHCATEEEKKAVKPVTKNVLIQWGLIREENGVMIPSNGFDLLSSNSIWSSKIQCAVFKGSDRSVFIDKRVYEGPVQSQIEEAYQFVLRNIHLGAKIKGLYRQDVYEIPSDVIRELITNAVVHRNYLENSHIQVSVFDDRLEITSPGGLLKGVSIEKMLAGFSKIRNVGLANAFFYMKLIEQWGTGIPRAAGAVQDCELPELEIIDMEDALKFTVYRKNGDKTAIKSKNGDKTAIKSKNGDKTAIKSERKNAKTLILEYLRSHKDATGKEISEMLGLKASRTKFYLNELEAAGQILTSGANKNRLYMLKKERSS